MQENRRCRRENRRRVRAREERHKAEGKVQGAQKTRGEEAWRGKGTRSARRGEGGRLVGGGWSRSKRSCCTWSRGRRGREGECPWRLATAGRQRGRRRPGEDDLLLPEAARGERMRSALSGSRARLTQDGERKRTSKKYAPHRVLDRERELALERVVVRVRREVEPVEAGVALGELRHLARLFEREPPGPVRALQVLEAARARGRWRGEDQRRAGGGRGGAREESGMEEGGRRRE